MDLLFNISNPMSLNGSRGFRLKVKLKSKVTRPTSNGIPPRKYVVGIFGSDDHFVGED
jgi:hypothetical protein